MAEDQIYWTESQIALVEQARDAAQTAARRVQTAETRLGNVEERVQLVDAEVARRQQQIAALIAANIPEHQWNGTELRLRNPDGGWGAWSELVGADGQKGWSPVLAVEVDGARNVLRIADWVGGQGNKPNTGYVGAAGLVATAAEAANVRGGQGLAGFNGWSPVLAIEADGAREVVRIAGWAGGSGAAPAVGAYLGPLGLVATAAEAANVRGAEGQPGADGGSTAALVAFDHAANGFTASNVQTAIEEAAGRIGGIGTVRYKAGTAPAGYIRCDGATYLQSAYPALFAQLGKIGTYKTGVARGTGGFNSLIYGGGLYVAVGNTAAISTSPDGVTWTSRTAPAAYAGHLRNVIWTGSAYIAVGAVSDSVNVLRSTDGVTWSKPTGMPGGLVQFDYVAASPSIIFAISATGANTLYSEDAGLTWSSTGLTGTGTMTSTSGLVYIAALGLFVAFGGSGAIHTSPNGKAWTKRTQAAAYAGTFTAIAYDPAFGIILGGNNGEIQTSPDGIAWTHRFSAGGGINGFAIQSGRIIAFGGFAALTSTDAVSWVPAVTSNTSSLVKLAGIDGGVLGIGPSNQVVISHPPFSDWWPVAVGSSYAGSFNLIAANGTRVVAIGSGANGIQTFDPVYSLATEFAVPNITPPGTGAIPYIKAI